MKKIETLVFDYGGVIVNIDDHQVVSSMTSLGVSRLKQLWYARTIKRLMHQYINGLVPEEETLLEMQALCRKGTTIEQILEVLERLCGDLPTARLKTLAALKKRYKVYLLSNINNFLWVKCVKQIRERGFEPEQLFDELFLSYKMQKEKPSAEIYQELIDQTGLNPATTLYFDDRKENAEAGKRFGFQSVWVRSNHLEEHDEWKELIKATI